MAKSVKKADCRADTRGGRWLGIPMCVIRSDAYRYSSRWGRCVLFEIVAVFSGYNNGKIAVSITQLCERLNTTNRRAVCAAIAELMEHGLIDISVEGSWAQRRAREYRLTFVSTMKGHLPVPATNDYLHWRRSGGKGASPRTADSGDGASSRKDAAGKASLPRLLLQRRKTAESGERLVPATVTVCHPL